MKYLPVLIIISVLATSIFAQNTEKNIAAVYINGSITIDGYLNETEWKRAPSIDDFTQYDPVEGTVPTEKTTVYVLYDKNAIYIGAKLYDSNPKGIVRQLSRRDRQTHADRFEVLIDSNNDRLTAYRFAVNVSNVQEDGIYSQDGILYNGNWDGVWQSAAVVTDSGWSIEMRIPFSVLRFDRRRGEMRWGINFRRFIARKNEEIHWVVVPRRETGLVSRFGTLRGMRNVNLPLQIEFLPYVVSQRRLRSGKLQPISENEYHINTGVDVKFGLSRNTTLDVTVNPDFGQVEIDETIVNLSAFETFYPEKRPFFLEGADLFRFGSTQDKREMYLFYSRRIGRRPAQPHLESGQQFIEVPQATTILGAAKLTSRTAGGLSIGTLSVYTDREDALIQTTEGERLRIPVVPSSSYNVFRLRQEILNNSSVGLMATGVLRDEERAKLSGGVDWNLRFLKNNYVIDGFIVATSISQNNNPMEEWAGRLHIAKPGGKHWLASANYEYFSRGFNPNDIGFIRRADYQGVKGSLSYKEDHALFIFRRYSVTLAAESSWNIDGKLINQNAHFFIFSEYKNFWASTILYQYFFPGYDDFETRGLELYKRPGYHMVDGWIGSDSRKRVALYPRYNISWADYGMTEIYLSVSLNIRPSTFLDITPSMGAYFSDNYPAWFSNIFDDDLGMISLFGDRNLEQFDLTLSGIISPHSRLSFQFFTQVLTYRAWYQNFRYLAAPDDLRLYNYRDHAQYNNPDFNYQAFNASIILRWEYKRGSTIYAVWTQERAGIHTRIHQPLLDTLLDTFKTPIDNLFLIKVNYWFRV
jgi:hypothetical protein